MVIREMYLKRIRPFYSSELIKVITGVRRCGKSVLLKQIIDEVKKSGVEDKNILYLNFEDYKYRRLKEQDNFYEYVEERIDDNKKCYLFFDEIQNVEGFEEVINSFRAVHNVSIFITGSNSRLLSGELASHLGGRTISFRIMPFAFREYCELYKNEKSKEELLDDYIEWGGFPILASVKNDIEKETILSNLYDSIVLKDIILRNKIASPDTLEKIIDYIVANSSLTVSAKSIAGALSDENRKTSVPTIYDYIKYITDACIVDKVERYDIRGKKLLSFEEKFYVCDLGLFRLKKNRIKDEYNLIVETIVYNELISRGYKVYIGKTYKGEVDFIAQRNNERFYVQACYVMDRSETVEREFGAYKYIEDNYPKYVVSMDKITNDREGIKHLRLMDFLLNDIN